MYSLMLVLSLLATAAFLHVFAFGRRKYLPLFAVLLALMLYTHNWGLFLAAGLVCALVPCWYVSEVRVELLEGRADRLRLRGPALPAVAADAAPPGPAHRRALAQPAELRRAVQISKSLLGGGTPTVALVLAGGSGLAAVIARRVEDKERTAVIAGAVTVLATLAIAWLVSQVSPAWTTRYLGRPARPDAADRGARAVARRRPRARGARDHPRHLGDPALVRAREQVERVRPAQGRRRRPPRGRPRDLDAARAGAAARLPPGGPRRGAQAAFREPARGGRERPRDGLDGRLRQAQGRHSRQESRTPAC